MKVDESNATECQHAWADANLVPMPSGGGDTQAPAISARSIPAPNGPSGGRPPSGLTAQNLTDTGNAMRFARHLGHDFRYCAPWKSWLFWDGKRWTRDHQNQALGATAQVIAMIYAEAAEARARNDVDLAEDLVKHAHATEAAQKRRAILELARAEPPLPIAHEVLDSNPWLFNVANGTIDLRTGELRQHERTDFITKLAPVVYAASATAPTWDAFLARVLPSAEVRAFIQRFVGYALTGNTSAHALLFFYGTGANGKSTLLNVLLALLGEYAAPAPADLLLSDRHARHPTELADLKGVRLSVAAEIEGNREFAEARLKMLTSDDPIKARRMGEDFWDFTPTHKLVIAANYKPVVRGTDEGIWRRINLVPFDETIRPEERDPFLADKLRSELSGILNWALRGLAEWRSGGLSPPGAVKAASSNYRTEMDVIGRFLEDSCEVGPHLSCAVAELRRAYDAWCRVEGEAPISSKALTQRLLARGIEPARTSSARTYRGVSVQRRDEEEEPSRYERSDRL